MPGLHRAKDETRQQDAFALIVLGGIEKLTYSLQRGDMFSQKALDDMKQMQRRLDAFSSALDRRMQIEDEKFQVVGDEE